MATSPRQPGVAEQTLPAKLKAAHAQHQQGYLDQAEVLYREILQSQPQHFDALQLLAAIAAQRKHSALAVEMFDRALEINPGHAESLNNRGNALRDLKRSEEALASYGHALELKPDYAEAHNNLGITLRDLKRPEEALASFERALQLKPDYAEALNNRGIALRDLKRLEEALASYEDALELKPDHAEALNNRGNVLRELGRPEEALASFERALALKSDYPEALNNQGVVLLALNRPEEALASFDHALAIKPDYVEALNSRGNALHSLDRLDEALTSYYRVLRVKPEYVEVLINLGIVFSKQDKQSEALICFDKALAIRPDSSLARWHRVFAAIPKVVGPQDDVAEFRARFSRELAELDAWLDAARGDAHEVVGVAEPFWLAYQDENNCELLRHYGALCARLMKGWQDRQTVSPKSVENTGKTRIGIVSAHVRRHSVWTAIVKGWLQHMHGDRIEIHIFHIGSQQDSETAWASSFATSFEQGPKDLHQWVGTIQSKQPEVLIYPEIGMDPMTVKLASLRLAPVQVVAWGHPETSGLPTMDYYLSAEAIEPPKAQDNYTEQLVMLPRLGCCYTPLRLRSTEPDLAMLGIDAKVPLLICPGMPFKYTPEYDLLLVRIAGRLGRCQFVFFDSPARELSAKLRRRLELSFSEAGLQFADYGVFIPWQSPEAFYGLMKRADVFLDTTGFSGFNTAMQAVECSLPIVTHEGRFMRGRLASGILHLMGVSELVASDAAGYVELAVRIASDAEYRESIRRRIQASRGILFEDISTVRALEDFLLKISRRNAWQSFPCESRQCESEFHCQAMKHPAPTLTEDERSILILGQTRLPPPELSAPGVSEPPVAATQTDATKLKTALALHQQGHMDQAETLYREILKVQPQHFDALQLLGMIAAQCKNSVAAVDLIDQALTIDPVHAGALNNRGNALRDLKRHEEALESFDKALAARPDYAEALNNRGAVLCDLKRYEEALASYDKALVVDPDYAEAHFNRGRVLRDLNRIEDALASYDRALRIKGEYAEALNSRGAALRELSQLEESLECYEQVLRIRPGRADPYYNRGNVLRDLRRSDEALESYERALELKPDYAEALCNRGNALRDLNRPEEAKESYERALEVRSDFAEAVNNRGAVLLDLNRHAEALASYEQALKIKPDYAEAHSNEALCRLAMGDFDLGWRKHEWRWKTEEPASRLRHFAQPLWLGETPITGKTLLLHPEQGFGDTLQFCRYASLAVAQGARVVLEVPAALKALCRTVADVDTVVAVGEALPPFDLHIPLMSLPLAFGTRLDTIPTGVPYLRAEPERVAAWHDLLGERGKPRVGLAWSGKPTHRNDRNRSLPFALLADIIDDVAEFVCLQKEFREEDENLVRRHGQVRIVSERLKDFADTAALIETLDLVITVDTSVAHLAGALGKPVWILLPFSPDWRWLLEREDSPWYPSARLFRQAQPGQWTSLLNEVRQALAEHCAGDGKIEQAVPALPKPDNPVAASPRQAGAADRESRTKLKAAYSLHQQGHLDQAGTLYREILESQPQHFDALQLLATIAVQRKNSAVAVAMCEQALAIRPDHVNSHFNLGIALSDLKRLDQAVESYDRALGIKPDYLDALLNRGNVLRDLNRPEQALESYDRALKIKPDYAEALLNRGNVLRGLRRLDEALGSYDGALKIRPDDADALLNRGNTLCDLNRLEEAVESYERALKIQPGYAEALYNRGNALRDLNRNVEALESYDRALMIAPDYAAVLLNRGNVLRALKRPEDALESYDRALRADPDNAETLHIRGVVLLALKRPAEALESHDCALKIDPNYAAALSGRGNTLFELERHEEALQSYDCALALNPDNPESLNNRGNALFALKRFEEAVDSYGSALKIKPDYAEALSNRGSALLGMRRVEDALASYDLAIRVKPDFADVFSNRGNALRDLKRPAEALASFDQAIRIKPDYADAFNNRGNALRDLSRPKEALESYRKAVELKPDFAEAYGNLGVLLRDMVRIDEAEACFRRALEIKPDCLRYAAHAHLQFPVIPETCESIAHWRRRYQDGIAILASVGIDGEVANLNPWSFFLAYHNEADKPVMEALRRMFRERVAGLTATASHVSDFTKAVVANRRIRVGFASEYLVQHTIGKLFQGIICRLDRSRFEVVVIHSPRTTRDEFRKKLDASVDRVLDLPAALADQQAAVMAERLDVLFYPDIGMNPATYFLAYARLAPVQAVSWGHPDTTGLDSMDYFVSAASIEPLDGDEHYTERLIRLNRLPCYYQPISAPTQVLERAALGLPEGGTLYGCPQSLFKFHPEFDPVLATIAEGDRDGRIVLIEGHNASWTKRLKARWARSHPVLLDRVTFLPMMPLDRFMSLMARLDILLDPIHFGSGNTMYEAMVYGTPIVTWPGRFMRGRLVAGCYSQMGIENPPVAESIEHYAQIALTLGRRPELRRKLKQDLLAAAGAELFEDIRAVREFEHFLLAAVAAAQRGERLPMGWRPSCNNVA